MNVLTCFPQRRDVYGAWEQYLGLEHSDNTPKRAYAVNQVKFVNAKFFVATSVGIVHIASFTEGVLMANTNLEISVSHH